ncbi:MAG: DUF6125 family protein, partial [Promethearchaeota archaeon]
MDEKDFYKDLNLVYARLAQTLDGLWFVKLEEQFGFEKALEIDDRVWAIYGKIEARRLKAIYEQYYNVQKEKPIKQLEILLNKSLFNATLTYDVQHAGEKELLFLVNECKTLAGMKKIGRPQEQIDSICYKIGLSFYKTFAH